MKCEHENKAIGCSVETCKFHSKSDNLCTLNNIEVGACNAKPETPDSTCCQSFQNKATF